eukprot:6178109-Pleurochrysis_carterae.AAC.4
MSPTRQRRPRRGHSVPVSSARGVAGRCPRGSWRSEASWAFPGGSAVPLPATGDPPRPRGHV